ncbi:MAG: iron chelate uptake ABC transporter family permease subunit [Bulleidia sp.]
MRKHRPLWILALLAGAGIAVYMLAGLAIERPALARYMLKLRSQKTLALLLTAYAIGSASIVFQTIIHNRVVTPCLLGMDSLYSLIHTILYFFLGAASSIVLSNTGSFLLDIALMGIVSAIIYGLLFQKTGHQILYVLLIGTILTSFFGSLQSVMVRLMDPNEYDALLATLVASFNNMHTEVLLIDAIVLAVTAFAVRKDLALLDVIALGRSQAISLGVDYDRTVKRLLIAVSFYIACATALVGPLAFLGLILANLARQYCLTGKHSQLIPASVLFGILVLTFGQTLTERIFHYNVPVSVFITIGGGIYFLYLLLKGERA